MIVRITRVKVGNRQAPQQHQKPHPEKVGFLRLRATKHVNGPVPDTAPAELPALNEPSPTNYSVAKNFCASRTQYVDPIGKSSSLKS